MNVINQNTPIEEGRNGKAHTSNGSALRADRMASTIYTHNGSR